MAQRPTVLCSAGPRAKTELNELSVESLAEVGVDISAERTTQLTEAAVRAADVVIVLGADAQVDEIPGTRFERWITDEPSLRGIEGMPRMRLIRDDIAPRVRDLAQRLGVVQPTA